MRTCPICGEDMTMRRRQAVYCGPACRREASRFRALLAGQWTDGYGCLRDYLNRRRNMASNRA